jgi:hypothetical protein
MWIAAGEQTPATQPQQSQTSVPYPTPRASAQPISIVRKLLPKDVAKYDVQCAITQEVTLPTGVAENQTQTITGAFEMRMADDVEAGKLPFTLTANLKIQSSPKLKSDSKGKKIVLRGSVDSQNEISDVSVQGVGKDDRMLANLVARMAQGVGTYPSQPVKSGDTWTVSEQKSFLGDKKIEYALRFDGMQPASPTTLTQISANTDVPVEVDSSDTPGASSAMLMKGTIHIEAQSLLDPSGTMGSLLFETKADITVDSAGASGQVRVSADEVLRILRKN